jgi:hypothetical protein
VILLVRLLWDGRNLSKIAHRRDALRSGAAVAEGEARMMEV